MISIPNEIHRLMGLLSNAYTSSLPRIPMLMEERFPPNNINTLPISCLIWNVQGVGSRAFLVVLKDLVKQNKPNVIALLETHMGGTQAEKIAKALCFSGHSRVDAQGFSGGIWVYWRKEEVTVEPILKEEQYITMTITRNGSMPWYFSAIYASPDPTKRQELWQELRQFAESHNEPWLLAGDFNETRYPSERSNSSRESTRRSHQFNEWIDELHLLELEFSGASHTWSRGLSPETRQSGRLDRALCNDAWCLMFDQAHVRHLPAVQSDHSPLFISPNGFVPIQDINKPFRFQATWLTHEQFHEFVHDKWRLDYTLIPALNCLASELKIWN